MFFGKFGSQAAYHAPVLSLGQHQHYRNQTLWLRLDKPELALCTEDSIKESTWVLNKKYGEPGFILPMQEPYTQHLSETRRAVFEQNLAFLHARPELFAKIMAYHQSYTHPVNPQTDIDAALYQSAFMTDAENKLCQRFHSIDIHGKIQLLPKLGPCIQNRAIRVLGRHHYQELPEQYQKQFDEYLLKVFSLDETLLLSDYAQQKRYSLNRALTEIAELRLRSDLSPKQLALLDELEAYALDKKKLVSFS
jgi:exodeoxyribonuclease-1